MTPDEMRKAADEIDEAAKAAFRQGKKEEGAVLLDAAEELRRRADEREREAKGRLPRRNHPRIMSGKTVTTSQLKRRGAAVARGKAAKGGSPVAIAITQSRWKTITAYAEHLGISQPALSRYISGDLPCPRFVADAVKADFDLDHKVWSQVVD